MSYINFKKVANPILLQEAQKLVDAYESIKLEPNVDQGKVLFFQKGLKQIINDFEHGRIPVEQLQDAVAYAKHIIDVYNSKEAR